MKSVHLRSKRLRHLCGRRASKPSVILPLWCICWLAIEILAFVPLLAATSLSQFGITWTFDRDYPSGQFANGDYWVVGPVTIVSIDPNSVTIDGRTTNGSMINPAIGKAQGYDSATYGPYGPNYRAELNVALGVSESNPLVVSAGASLVSSISIPIAGARPQLDSIAILTILDKPAPMGSFRPPYVGTDKSLRWNRSQLDYTCLKSLPRVQATPQLSVVTGYFERPWIEQNPSWEGRYLHPVKNQPDYGRDMAYRVGAGLLLLHLGYSKEQKELLLIRMVQYGIDIYGAARSGAVWSDLGGHNHGRKMPLLLAGVALQDPSIIEWADATKHMIFQEDRQTWYVTENDVGRSLYDGDGRRRDQYLPSDVGVPEWGEQHTRQPDRDGRNWDAYYRDVVGFSTLGHWIAAKLMKVEDLWKWPAYFDYCERFWSIEKGSGRILPFYEQVWKAHQQTLPPKPPHRLRITQ